MVVHDGRRSQDHEDVLSLLGEAGADGAELAKEFARLLPLKTKTEYEPDAVSRATAAKAVERARRCVAVAHRVVRAQAPAGGFMAAVRNRNYRQQVPSCPRPIAWSGAPRSAIQSVPGTISYATPSWSRALATAIR